VYTRATMNGKRALCLGGAKNHIFLLPDAHKKMSGKGIRDSFTGCAGQRCMAASVLLAIGPVEEQLQELVSETQKIVLGDSMGAIITQEKRDQLIKYIEQAEKEGAKILVDGRNFKAPEGKEKGHWLGPTIIDQVAPQSELATKELFGPILSIIRCGDLSQAIEIENKNPYGNAASVFTSSGALAEKVVRRARAAMVGINVGVPVPREPFSFAGIFDSKFGHGEITGQGSLSFWSDLKKVTTRWEESSEEGFASWMS